MRIYAGQMLKHLVDKKYIRMSERDVESSDGIKDMLTKTFLDPDPQVRKLCSQIMARTLIQGGYLSWPELIDFFIKNLNRAEKCAAVLEIGEGSTSPSS